MRDTFVTTGEVARALGVTINTVKSWIRAGTLEALRLPSGHHRIPSSELDRLIAEGRLRGVQLNPLRERRRAWKRFESWRRELPVHEIPLEEVLAHMETMLALARSRGPLEYSPPREKARRVARLHRALACLSS